MRKIATLKLLGEDLPKAGKERGFFMLKEKAVKVSGKLMEKIVKKEETKWPPHCVGFLHQPKRPANKTKDN
mgnify:FL=1